MPIYNNHFSNMKFFVLFGMLLPSLTLAFPSSCEPGGLQVQNAGLKAQETRISKFNSCEICDERGCRGCMFRAPWRCDTCEVCDESGCHNCQVSESDALV